MRINCGQLAHPAIAVFAVTICITFSRIPSAHGADSSEKTIELLKSFADEFVAITPGEGKFPASFEMGSTDGDVNEMPVHKVTLKHKFGMAKYEVPQNLYEAVMGNNPSRWKGPRNSVEMMSSTDANSFCNKITALLREQKLIANDETIRLPTEAEWEYSCRAGTTTRYSFGDDAQQEGDEGNKASLLDKYGWHTGNAAGNDPPVGALKPNPWGLYDMHGYLWELTSDDWSADYTDAPTDGSAVESEPRSNAIVIRSGSWKDKFDKLTSTTRRKALITSKDDALGFRCVKARP